MCSGEASGQQQQQQQHGRASTGVERDEVGAGAGERHDKVLFGAGHEDGEGDEGEREEDAIRKLDLLARELEAHRAHQLQDPDRAERHRDDVVRALSVAHHAQDDQGLSENSRSDTSGEATVWG
eukprot:1781986-Rhodomonas_salina.1